MIWHNILAAMITPERLFTPMEQKKEQRSGLEAPGPDNAPMRSAEQMQEDNATGAMDNDQGQASFVAGATTGGGSDFGQGSSHLGSESYQQGEKLSAGSNYENEAEGLGRSPVGTSDEGTAAPAGTASSQSRLPEGDRHATNNEGDVDLPRRSATGSGRPPSGSWSQSSTDKD